MSQFDSRPRQAMNSDDVEPQSDSQQLEHFSRLAAGVVHDFNNLLTVILGASELLADKIPEDHPQRVFLEQIRQAAQKGTSLVHQLKTLSKFHP